MLQTIICVAWYMASNSANEGETSLENRIQMKGPQD